MSAESVLYGAIMGAPGSSEHGNWTRTLQLNFATINLLPDEDDYPAMPRRMFSCPRPSTTYRDSFFHTQVITFGGSYNHFSGEWAGWLAKFEALLRKLYWTEARLHLDMEHYGAHDYRWTPTPDQFDRLLLAQPLPIESWELAGGPRAFSA